MHCEYGVRRFQCAICRSQASVGCLNLRRAILVVFFADETSLSKSKEGYNNDNGCCSKNGPKCCAVALQKSIGRVGLGMFSRGCRDSSSDGQANRVAELSDLVEYAASQRLDVCRVRIRDDEI